MARPPYTKELNQPILPDHRPNDGLPKTRDRSREASEAARIERERAQKVMLLFEHYSIDPRHPEAWKYLALNLALDHVKGFSVSKDRGHPTRWTPARLYLLYGHYLRVKRGFLRSNKNTAATDELVGKRMLKDDRFEKDFPALTLRTLTNNISKARKQRELSNQARRDGRHQDVLWFGVNAFSRKHGKDPHDK